MNRHNEIQNAYRYLGKEATLEISNVKGIA